MPELHETRTGVKFFDHDVPRIADSLAKIASSLARMGVVDATGLATCKSRVWLMTMVNDPTQTIACETSHAVTKLIVAEIDSELLAIGVEPSTLLVNLPSDAAIDLVRQRAEALGWMKDEKRSTDLVMYGWRVVLHPVVR